jgi:nucleotide-binding universal stress UspA family protein
MQQKRFVIATDGSPGGLEALQQGLRLAQNADAAVTVAYVRSRPLPLLGEPFYQGAVTKELGVASAVLADASREIAAAHVDGDTAMLEGDAADGIVELARSRAADLIVVGSRGRGAVAGALLGSVSESIVHKADRPVLVVKPRAADGRRAA